MPFDLKAFEQSVTKEVATDEVLNPDEKWPVKGWIIREAWSMIDDGGEYFWLVIDGNDEIGTTYVLRYGDPPGLPFAEELDREIKAGLIEIKPGPPPEINPL